MDVDNVNTMVSSLRALKLLAVEKFVDDCEDSGDIIFGSFEIHNNTQEVSVDLMKHIATFAKKSLGMSKPIRLPGFTFLRVTQQTKWMHRIVDNIGLPEYLSSAQELLMLVILVHLAACKQ